jgi:hypothetical protein
MSWEDLKQSLSSTYRQNQQALEELTAEQVEKIEDTYITHIQTQMKKPTISERDPFEDEFGGFWLGLRFPSKNPELDNPSTYAEPKVAKNGSTQWWGPRYAMMNGSVITVFFPEGWKQGKGGQFGFTNEKTHQWIFVYRGTLKIEYKWIEDPKKKYARPEPVFLQEASERYGRPIKSIEEVEIGDMGQRRFTFNPNQIIKVLK